MFIISTGPLIIVVGGLTIIWLAYISIYVGIPALVQWRKGKPVGWSRPKTQSELPLPLAARTYGRSPSHRIRSAPRLRRLLPAHEGRRHTTADTVECRLEYTTRGGRMDEERLKLYPTHREIR